MRRPATTLALLGFSSLITSLDFTIIYVALPDIARDIGFSGHSMQWVVSAYAIFFGGLLLLGGRCADLLGRRRLFVLGMVVFGIASLLGGVATTTFALIAARAVQGAGAALLFPATLSLVNTMFEEGRQRIRALAVWAMAGAGGLSLGALLGGVLTSAFGWQAVFLINIPLVVVGAVAAFPLLRADGPRAQGRFDVPGALTGTLGTTLLVFTVAQGPESGWTSAPVLGGGALAVVLLAAFLVIESRSDSPLMPLQLARGLGPVLAVIFVFGATMQNIVYFLTLFLQNVWSYSALVTGLVFLSLSLVIAVANFVAERLIVRIGIRATLIAGLLLGAVGGALLAAGMVADGSYRTIVAAILVYGAGMGTVYPTMYAAAGTGVAEQAQGTAGGMANTAMQVGIGAGLAVLVGIANAGTTGLDGDALPTATADGLRSTVGVASALILLGLLAACSLPNRRAVPAEVAYVSPS
ncbi:MFS transporter [Nocardia speluncae]|uniref:MFS transporter n=1 Tax=Nocardia speluncae TaxID=419477 RepID=A0A846XUL9_9NOCA|nr:MFS transporter [Nocardia speluncae]NKY37214.1 MFS transporter [Nocardia speluncae]